VAPDGSVYVTYWKKTRIQKFDSAGGFVIKWGFGDPPGSWFKNSRGVAVAPDGSVYVTEWNGNSIQKWSVGP
jgi:streptogramin lyase